MQSEPIIGSRLEFVGSVRIYVTSDGRLVVPMGNQRVTVSQGEAKAMLDNLFLLAVQFNGQALVSSNGHVTPTRV